VNVDIRVDGGATPVFGDDAVKLSISGASFWQPQHIVDSAWLEHGPFAFWITEAVRPKVFVELGTHNGFSYMAFCQAIRQLGLPAASFAVDTWEGDEHAGFYGQDIFTKVAARNDEHYADFSRLLRCRFDEALPHFADGSIDLLHIDGRHTYADVKQDFETWLPKLSRRGVVLFHDTNVRAGDFGVWRYWSELTERYPAFEFLHGHGLGVLAVGPDIPAGLRPLLDAPADQVQAIRAAYGRLGQGVSRQRLLETTHARLGEAQSALGETKTALGEAQAAVDSLRLSLTQHEAHLARIEQSLSWRAMQPARGLMASLPAPVRQTLRRGAKAVWWAVTPHRMRRRIALLRAHPNSARRDP